MPDKSAWPEPPCPVQPPWIPVALSVTDDYAPHAYAVMQSALDHALPGVKLAFYVLHGGLSAEDRAWGERLFNPGRLNAGRSAIAFLDVGAPFEQAQPAKLEHQSIATFYRLAIPLLFRGFEKVIYLDTDIYVNRCLSLLYYTMHNHRMVGACRDLLLKNAQNNGYRLPDEVGGGVGLVDYHRGALGVMNSDNYFQAGVILFNTSRIPDSSARELLALMKTLFWMSDQDILNRVFYGEVHFFNERWNACMGPGCLEESENLPPDWKRAYDDARNDPYCVHFTGSPKPWEGYNGPYADKARDALAHVMRFRQ